MPPSPQYYSESVFHVSFYYVHLFKWQWTEWKLWKYRNKAIRANSEPTIEPAFEAWKKIAPSVKISENIRGIVIIQLLPSFTKMMAFSMDISTRHGTVCSELGEWRITDASLQAVSP
jgi:hypothetical protein